jgi:hypothetical protein
VVKAFHAERGITGSELVVAILAELDVETCVRDAGLTARAVAALGSRLLD